jgi:hypothetical protein
MMKKPSTSIVVDDEGNLPIGDRRITMANNRICCFDENGEEIMKVFSCCFDENGEEIMKVFSSSHKEIIELASTGPGKYIIYQPGKDPERWDSLSDVLHRMADLIGQ